MKAYCVSKETKTFIIHILSHSIDLNLLYYTPIHHSYSQKLTLFIRLEEIFTRDKKQKLTEIQTREGILRRNT